MYEPLTDVSLSRNPAYRSMLLNCTLVVVAMLLAATGPRAADFPSEIHIIVPLTAGSSLDARARIIAEAISQRIKRPVLVENRSGAGGTLGTLMVANAKPDGATLLFTNNSHVVSPHVYPTPGYDAIKDFVPIAQGYVAGVVLVAHPDLQVRSIQDLLAKSRSTHEPLSYASSGSGGMPHLAMEMFKEAAGIELLHIPYRGDGQALTDLLAGRVPLMMSGYAVALPHIRNGSLRALAVSSRQRSEILPEVPTMAEAGFPSYALDIWTGFFAPAGIPNELVAKLNHEIAAAVMAPAVQVQLAATGAHATAVSPAKFAAMVKAEWETYGKLVRKLKLTAE
jgi:tripartite-type tricarboxylate transporter receptor subunit TctC